MRERVVDIQELTQDYLWKHVSHDNPADLVSKGINLQTLKDSKLWWDGPTFLQDPNFELHSNNTENNIINLPEVKSLHVRNDNSNDCTSQSLFPFSRFSQFNRLQRTMAYIKRFLHNSHKTNLKRSGALSVDELREALQVRTKWTKSSDTLKEGTFVLIKDDNSPPLKWCMGRIVSTFPGKDGISRVATIRTASGAITRRAFPKICPLPLDSATDRGDCWK
ncbi:unnamed protein product, partial [Brenthis ino]